MQLSELITMIARALVDDPDAVAVFEVEGTHTTIIELTVAKEDLGKVIGRHGRTAEAMRTILSAAAVTMGKKSVLEIIEPRP